jgi:hypothetical protein
MFFVSVFLINLFQLFILSIEMPSMILAENTDRLSENHCVEFLDTFNFVSIIGATSKLSAEGYGVLDELGQSAIFAVNTVPLFALNPGRRMIDLAAL